MREECCSTKHHGVRATSGSSHRRDLLTYSGWKCILLSANTKLPFELENCPHPHSPVTFSAAQYFPTVSSTQASLRSTSRYALWKLWQELASS